MPVTEGLVLRPTVTEMECFGSYLEQLEKQYAHTYGVVKVGINWWLYIWNVMPEWIPILLDHSPAKLCQVRWCLQISRRHWRFIRRFGRGKSQGKSGSIFSSPFWLTCQSSRFYVSHLNSSGFNSLFSCPVGAYFYTKSGFRIKTSCRNAFNDMKFYATKEMIKNTPDQIRFESHIGSILEQVLKFFYKNKTKQNKTKQN